MTDWADALRWGIAWGPGLVILVGLYKLLKEPPRFVEEFVESQQAQAVAMTKMAVAVERATQRDNSKLDELLVGQQLTLGRIDHLEDKLDTHEGAHGPG